MNVNVNTTAPATPGSRYTVDNGLRFTESGAGFPGGGTIRNASSGPKVDATPVRLTGGAVNLTYNDATGGFDQQ
ncbi:MAG TPA: hypothetical protein VM733_01865 [Thermoanaerobaculia bacterium]|nr:hypothetical protein [Thermoanaerobaculia bacterium]